MTGKTVSHYEVLEKLAQGGMGVVYKARDTRLGRLVALKLLPADAVADLERRSRFVQEARAASALNHPNIVVIYDIDMDGDVPLIAMEYLEGEPLARVLASRSLPIHEALRYGLEIAEALAAAHRAGIVHRDIKPANVMITAGGHVKVLDFGLAKLGEAATADGETVTLGPVTQQGMAVGTVAYMSPEQAEGKGVDARSDIFSLGVVLYEMLAGRRPFESDSQLSVLTAILRDTPAPLRKLRADVPQELERIVCRCLEKDRAQRYASSSELASELSACRAKLTAPRAGVRSLLRRPRLAVPATALLIGVIALGGWLWVRGAHARWARNQALPEIGRLVETGQFPAAFRLARQAEAYIPDDAQLQRTWGDLSARVPVRTTPPGAEVAWKPYLAAGEAWEPLGRTPVENARVPIGYLRWRIAKDGFEPVEMAVGIVPLQVVLSPQGTAPAGMVRVPGGGEQAGDATVQLGDYWLDKFEVTNRQYQAFVDSGGYQKSNFWKPPFVKDGHTLSFEQAMAEFRDTTGRPGPATWELGAYPKDRPDHPVSGVSWYEAAAYCEFAGKTLPTVHHWRRAAGLGIFSDILLVSNFAGQGPARAGVYQGLGPYGTYDMAGNVKEWCWNQSGSVAGAARFILGGAWNEPSYMFTDLDAQSAFQRLPTYGFRCAKCDVPPADAVLSPIHRLWRDYSKEKPVGDEIFQVYRSMYSYDRGELNSKIEAVDDSSEYWRKEKITYQAAYGNERVIAYLFLPRKATPPYQTVVFSPGGYAAMLPSSRELWIRNFEFLIRGGRAVLHPIYKGTYERRIEPPARGPSAARERVSYWMKDLGRSLDYLETRPDIDAGRIGYYGLSTGAYVGVFGTALEPRFKVSVLVGGGFLSGKSPPEVDLINFAPRARIPVLMVNGRQDFVCPLEASQQPMFRFLGAPEKDKRHFVYEGGHAPMNVQVLIKEVLDWLDRYLGPVRTGPIAKSP